MDPKHLFRKAALEKLSSPERLDVMMQVTSPAAWLALTALGTIIVLMVVWSVVGSISIKVRGKGMLLRGSVLFVQAPAPGQVTEILVSENDIVHVGDIVARLSQGQLDLQVTGKQSELDGLRTQLRTETRTQAGIRTQLQAELAKHRETEANQRDLVEKGLLTPKQLTQTQQEIRRVGEALANIDQRLAELRNRRDAAQRELRELESQRQSSTEVKSAHAGRVLEITTSVGSRLEPGKVVLTLEPLEEQIEAVIYLPAGDGKKVKPGMLAQISPSTVRKEEYGSIIAEVRSVSEYPVTPEGLQKVLRNPKLVEELTGRSAAIQVMAMLIEDPETVSKFRWSSSKGPPYEVYTGTVCDGAVTVEKKRPISYVLPIVRKTLGM